VRGTAARTRRRSAQTVASAASRARATRRASDRVRHDLGVRALHVERGKSGVDPVLPVHGLLTALRASHLEPQSCRAVRLSDQLTLDGWDATSDGTVALPAPIPVSAWVIGRNLDYARARFREGGPRWVLERGGAKAKRFVTERRHRR